MELRRNNDRELLEDVQEEDIGTNDDAYYKIAITGGPCAGKTTGETQIYRPLNPVAMANAVEHFTALGYRVLVVPETATLTMLAGGNVVVTNMKTKDAVKRGVRNLIVQPDHLDSIHQDAEVSRELLQLSG